MFTSSEHSDGCTRCLTHAPSVFSSYMSSAYSTYAAVTHEARGATAPPSRYRTPTGLIRLASSAVPRRALSLPSHFVLHHDLRSPPSARTTATFAPRVHEPASKILTPACRPIRSSLLKSAHTKTRCCARKSPSLPLPQLPPPALWGTTGRSLRVAAPLHSSSPWASTRDSACSTDATLSAQSDLSASCRSGRAKTEVDRLITAHNRRVS